MPALDYDTVHQYWSNASASILGPYMMDGFGFPASAGQFRFDSECKIVERLLPFTQPSGNVLDLGCGIGHWTEYFARNFANVTAVESSEPLFAALKTRCSHLKNADLICGDVLQFQAEATYQLIFLGGMLMYLNEGDVISLMRKITPSLDPGGLILCRETNVRQGSLTREGEYQAVYRSIDQYRDLFSECGLEIVGVQPNTPYILMQMGCESVKMWKSIVPKSLQCLPLMGRLVYWSLRAGNPWLTRVPQFLHWDFPRLVNHFFLLKPKSKPH